MFDSIQKFGLCGIDNTCSGMRFSKNYHGYSTGRVPFLGRTIMSPLRPGTNWADWSDAMGREMYLCRALDRLNFEYPSDDAS